MSEPDFLQFKLMIPALLKLHLEESAHANRRSLSKEIIARLEHTYGRTTEDHDVVEELKHTEETRRLRARLDMWEPLLFQATPAELKKLRDRLDLAMKVLDDERYRDAVLALQPPMDELKIFHSVRHLAAFFKAVRDIPATFNETEKGGNDD